jgi:ABC-type branched-subunit amino acid transport system substrate-binding protein
VNEVVARYAKTTGAPLASSLGVTGYVDAQVLAGGIDAAGSSDPVEIAKALESGKAFPTLVGPIKYSAELHIPTDRPMAVSKYTNGKPKLARYVTPPTGVSLGLGG